MTTLCRVAADLSWFSIISDHLSSYLFPKQHIGRKFFSFLLEKGLEVLREFPEQLNGTLAVLGDTGAAAALAARSKLDERPRGLPVHGIHEVPCVTVGHLHCLRGLGDGPIFTYTFKQDNAAVSQERPVGTIDPDATAKTRNRFLFSLSWLGLFVHERNIQEGITDVKWAPVSRQETNGFNY